MNRLTLNIAFLLLLASSAVAQLSDQPDDAILINQLNGVVFVDGYAVALSDNGMASYYYDDAESQFLLYDWLFIDYTEANMKVCGDRIAVHADDSVIHIIDISDLPDIEHAGSADFENLTFSDFSLVGNDLYLARWFDGVWRFNLNPVFEPVFVDSSMMGIFCTRVDAFGDSLYVLDEYNGLLLYDVSGEGFGDFLDYLYVPERAISFIRYGPGFCLLLDSCGAYFGEFLADGAEITDHISEYSDLEHAYCTESLLLLSANNRIYVVDRSDLSSLDTVSIFRHSGHGDLVTIDENIYLGLPYDDGGLTLFDINNDFEARESLVRTGPVTDLLIYEDQLAVSGQQRPIDLYQMMDSTNVEYDYTLYESYDRTAAMYNNGDTLFVLSNTLNSVIFIDNFNDPDSFAIVNGFHVTVGTVNDLHYVTNSVDGQILMMAVGEYDINVFRVVPDSGFVEFVTEWTFWGYDIQMAVLRGDVLFISANKGNSILSYRVRSDYTLEDLGGVGVTSEILKTIVVGDSMFVFQYATLHIVDISDPNDIQIAAITPLPYPVSDAAVYDNHLYTVSPSGIAVIRLAESQPVLVDTVAFAADFMAVGNEALTVSDGNGVFLFALGPLVHPTPVHQPEILPHNFALDQNYPNPFNLETTISFELERRTHVDLSIYNILGQRVTTLLDQPLPAGRHQVAWNGREASGKIVATGVYVYRLQTDQVVEARKMILLK